MASDWVLVGSVGRPHGIAGWVGVSSHTEPFTNILGYQPWYLTAIDETALRPVELEGHRLHGVRILVRFSGCSTPEAARLFTQHKIYVRREQFVPLAPQEYYWADLVGLCVYAVSENTYLGTVESLFSTGSNDVLVVRGTKKHLIPFLQNHTIKSINLNQQRMVVDWDPNF